MTVWGFIKGLDPWAGSHIALLNAKIIDLQAQLVQKDALIADLRAQLSDAQVSLANRTAELAEAKKKVDDLERAQEAAFRGPVFAEPDDYDPFANW